jgi:hypothetical protein
MDIDDNTTTADQEMDIPEYDGLEDPELQTISHFVSPFASFGLSLRPALPCRFEAITITPPPEENNSSTVVIAKVFIQHCFKGPSIPSGQADTSLLHGVSHRKPLAPSPPARHLKRKLDSCTSPVS